MALLASSKAIAVRGQPKLRRKLGGQALRLQSPTRSLAHPAMVRGSSSAQVLTSSSVKRRLEACLSLGVGLSPQLSAAVSVLCTGSASARVSRRPRQRWACHVTPSLGTGTPVPRGSASTDALVPPPCARTCASIAPAEGTESERFAWSRASKLAGQLENERRAAHPLLPQRAQRERFRAGLALLRWQATFEVPRSNTGIGRLAPCRSSR